MILFSLIYNLQLVSKYIIYNLNYLGLNLYTVKIVKVGNLKIRLYLHAPQHGSNSFDYRCIQPSYFKNTDGIILVYDITSHYSFENLTYYNEMIEEYSGIGVIKILAGNKFDEQEIFDVTEEEGHNFAMDNNYLFYQTSAKNNYNVNEVFDLIVKKLLNPKEHSNRDKKNDNKKKCLII